MERPMLEKINKMHKDGVLNTLEAMALINAMEFSQKALKGELGEDTKSQAQQEISGRIFQQTILNVKFP